MKINEEKLYDLYMDKVNELCELCDWKTTFGPKEIVGLIVEIIEKNEGKLVEPLELGIPDESKFLKLDYPGGVIYERWRDNILPVISVELSPAEIFQKSGLSVGCFEQSIKMWGEHERYEEFMTFFKSDEWNYMTSST